MYVLDMEMHNKENEVGIDNEVSTNTRTKSKAPIDQTDRYFMILVVEGFISPYAIWARLKKAAKETKINADAAVGLKVMAYNNVNKRIVKLLEAGLLEEMDLGDLNIRDRKNLKLTMNGLKYLVPYVLDNPESIQTIIKYMNKFNMDKTMFANLLVDRIRYTFDFLNSILITIKTNPELSGTYPTRAANQLQKVQKEMEVLLEMEKIRLDKAPTHEIAVRRIEDTTNVSDDVKTRAAHAIRTSTTVKRKH